MAIINLNINSILSCQIMLNDHISMFCTPQLKFHSPAIMLWWLREISLLNIEKIGQTKQSARKETAQAKLKVIICHSGELIHLFILLNSKYMCDHIISISSTAYKMANKMLICKFFK